MADAALKRKLFTRRRMMLLVGGAVLFGSARFGRSRLARSGSPSGPLSPAALELIAQAWTGLDPAQVLDCHVHVLGTGMGGTGCYVGKRFTSASSPIEYLKFTVYETAAGVTDPARCDVQYVDQLAGYLARERPHGRALIFAFDQLHDDDGRALPEESEFYTPNAYVIGLASKHPDYFVPCASVHPYRPDAVEALEKAVAGGCVAVKWLPNAMNIDPASARCDAFYDAMARLQVPLITHAGEEKAVHAEARQRLGNPLKLRRALEHGVTTVIAHCASLGSNPDLDQGEAGPLTDNFDLFKRLMAEPQWRGKLWGEASALTIVNRVGRPLREVLESEDLRERLVNGSDYPLPAVNLLMQTRAVESEGFITAAQRTVLNEIDQHDPLLFDFVMKRCLSWKGFRLPDAAFMVRREIFPRLARGT
ncbi:MAG: amidohydrolase family protein [Archangiaceae bacterium]|nr:amidohydrolase family protein [Archangiaceae bacterium]